jgi:multiple sugar transport system substrate-binding protein
MKRHLFTALGLAMVLSIVLGACAAPTPATIVQTVQVQVPVTSVVTQQVQVTQQVEVTRVVAGTPQVVEVTSTPQPQVSFQGVTVNIITFTGPQIAEPLQRRAPDFERLTGAKINVITVPFSDLYQKILTDLSTGTNSYDAFVFAPQWMGDYVAGGYLLDLSDRVKADTALQWDDIGPFFRDFSATYQGKIYTVPLDGDFQMVYYRKDIFQKDGVQPPQTWDDYIAIAQKYQGKDLNGDKKPDYGSCIAMKRSAQSYWMFISIASSFFQSQGTGQGAFFDQDNNFQPLYNTNDGMSKALDIYQQLSKLGPPDQLNDDVGNTRGLFTGGRCALSLDWGDIGPLSVDASQSKVINQVGSIILPGTKEVLDRKTGKLVPCDKTTCPNADANGINHAPFAAFGGWSGAINNASKVKDAAYAFLSYMSQPAQSNVDVTIGRTGFNPYRQSQFANLGPWLHSGMNEDMAKDYLGAIQASLQSPNMVLDLRIALNQSYEQVALDQALAQFLAGEIDKAKTMTQIADAWNAKTDELGRDKQLAAYKASLGVTK